MKKEKKIDIKLPSDTAKVTVEYLKKYCDAVAKTGKNFEFKDLQKQSLPHKSEDPIRRNLAYLKYLGFLEEKREKISKEGKKKKVQRFNQKNDPLVKDYFYYLVSGRNNDAESLWKRIIGRHPLSKFILAELFKEREIATIDDLEDILRKQDNSSSNARYYKNGAYFVGTLLEDIEIVDFDKVSEKFKLNEEKVKKAIEEKQEERTVTEEISVGLKENLEKGEVYLVSIKGADLNFDFKVRNKEDLEDVKTIIKIMEKKIKL